MSNPNQRRKEHNHEAIKARIAKMIREAKKIKRRYEKDGQADLFEHTEYASYLKQYGQEE